MSAYRDLVRKLDFEDPRERLWRVRTAAREGLAPALYDFGLTVDDPYQADRWQQVVCRERVPAAHSAGRCDD